MTEKRTTAGVALPIRGTCHCGAVSYEMRSQPRHAVSCNCTICRSLGSVWGHSLEADITIFAAPDATIAYSRGDRLLACHTSRTCGSTTHYVTIAGDHMGRMAVNLQLAAPGTIDAIGLRHFDGADTWSFLD